MVLNFKEKVKKMTATQLNEQLRAIDKALGMLDQVQTALFRKPDAAKIISDEAGVDASTAICTAKIQLERYEKTINAFMDTVKTNWPDV